MSSSLSRIRALLIDLSGTVHVDAEAIEGAVEAVIKLRNAKIPFKFVTNTTKESSRRLFQRLVKMGFKVSENEIFSSLTAARCHVLAHSLRPMLMLEEEALEDFLDIDTSNPNAVLVGLAPSRFNYEDLSMAFRLIAEKNAKLIAIHKARYLKTSKGLFLGPGCFVTGLEFSTGRPATVVGKPEEAFFKEAFHSLEKERGEKLAKDGKDKFALYWMSPEFSHLWVYTKMSRTLCARRCCATMSWTSGTKLETVMVGDDVKDDVLGAQNAGFKGCLVRTGKYLQGDESRFEGRPDFVFDSLAEFVENLLRARTLS